MCLLFLLVFFVEVEFELKLVEVEVTPDGYDPVAVPGSKMAVDNGEAPWAKPHFAPSSTLQCTM